MKTPAPQYTHWDVLLSSPTAPMPEPLRIRQLTAMWMGLAAMEQGKEPCPDDWRMCSDAVNLLETFVIQGTATDASGLLMDAITALALSGKRHLKGGSLRLDGPGMTAVRAVLEDYAELLDVLPARTVVQCHRATELRLRRIYAGKKQAHDIEVIGI